MSLQIRAKFKCNSVTDNGYNKNANLTAVYGKEGENADFSKATPSGTLSMSIDKDTLASTLFDPLKDYELLIREWPKEEK